MFSPAVYTVLVEPDPLVVAGTVLVWNRKEMPFDGTTRPLTESYMVAAAVNELPMMEAVGPVSVRKLLRRFIVTLLT